MLTKSYDVFLTEELRDPELAAEYLFESYLRTTAQACRDLSKT